ncbi:TRAP transporter small permease [Seohaeicola saemankumensis]|uniref:TRAP transporter small permease n=1 Tax=Seohaeicola TaxID=481178 RepID=UPI0035CEF384
MDDQRNSSVAKDASSQGRLLAIFDKFLAGCGVLSALGLFLIPVLVSLDVFGRHVLGSGILWAADACEYLLYASTMIGAPWLLHLGRHVSVDILPSILKGQAARLLDLVLNSVMLVVCSTLIFFAFEAFQIAQKFGSTFYKTIAVPVWPFIAIFIASFIMISIELVVRIITGRTPHHNNSSV